MLVACVVGDAHAQPVVVHAVVFGGARPTVVPPSLSQIDEYARSCSALVWDGAPWDHDAVSFLEGLAQRRPDLPVLVLLPPSGQALRFVSLCPRQPGVQLSVFDNHTSRPDHIAKAVGALLAGLPPFVVTKAIGRFGGNPWLRRALWCALTQVGRGARPTVPECAEAVGCSPRTLERLLRSAQFPTPKELIDWATALHMKHAEMTTGHRPADLGRAIGLTGNDVYRIRQRLAQRVDVEPRTIRDANFHQVFDYCTKRCGLLKARNWADSLQSPEVA